MTELGVKNWSRTSKYFDCALQRFVEPSDIQWTTDQLSRASFYSHRENSFNNSLRPDQYKPVIGNLILVPPRTEWGMQDGRWLPIFKELMNPIKHAETTPLKLVSICKKYLSFIKQVKIGVEMSGGLDTGVIVSLLRAIGSEPALIGMQANRFEFRTEKTIQELYFSQAKKSLRIDESSCLPYSRLCEVPKHVLPQLDSLFIARHIASADAARNLDLEILFNGEGADSLLTLEGPQIGESFYARFHQSIFSADWADQYVFQPRGIRYVDPFALKMVWRFLLSARINQTEDSQKVWARKYFERYLPAELSGFAYKSGFDGIWIRGVEEGIPDIRKICKFTYEITRQSEFSVIEIDKLVHRYLYLHDPENPRLLRDFMARISFATWIHSSFASNTCI